MHNFIYKCIFNKSWHWNELNDEPRSLIFKVQDLMTAFTLDLKGYKQTNMTNTKVKGHILSDLEMIYARKEKVKNNTPPQISVSDGGFIGERSFQCQKVTVVTSCWWRNSVTHMQTSDQKVTKGCIYVGSKCIK